MPRTLSRTAAGEDSVPADRRSRQLQTDSQIAECPAAATARLKCGLNRGQRGAACRIAHFKTDFLSDLLGGSPAGALSSLPPRSRSAPATSAPRSVAPSDSP